MTIRAAWIETFARLAERVRDGALPAAAMAIGDARRADPARDVQSATRSHSIPNSNFFLASVTKPIIATAFMQLVEEGRVGLHQPIAEFEPRLNGGGREQDHAVARPDAHVRPVRLRSARYRTQAAERDEQMTNCSIDSPLRFEPGTQWEYVQRHRSTC